MGFHWFWLRTVEVRWQFASQKVSCDWRFPPNRPGLLPGYVLIVLYCSGWLRCELTLMPDPKLLASPSFHRMVGRVHQKVQHIRHGVPPEEMGGTKIDKNGMTHFSWGCWVVSCAWDWPVHLLDDGLQRFARYFKEEIKDQFKGKPPNKLWPCCIFERHYVMIPDNRVSPSSSLHTVH